MRRAGLYRAAAACLLLPLLAATARAADIVVEFSGELGLETRVYPGGALHAGQRAHASGATIAPTLYAEDEEGRSVSISPFFRYDAADPQRTHADLREAYLLLFGEAGEGEWELRLGVDRVAWGVAELRNPVDIVNQTDLVEHPDEKTKLGQPMAHATWSADWGALELFLMPWHRERTYPGRKGRLRSRLVVDRSKTTWESAAERRHLDWAARYSGSFGPVDLGLSYFDGQSREPFLRPAPGGADGPVLAPHYGKIRQAGLDMQVTTGPWLLKLEAIRRMGAHRARADDPFGPGEKEDYGAWAAGGEYGFYGVFGSAADLTLLAEWHRDGRGAGRATNAYENDLFLAARLALNDVESTEFTVSLVEDLARSGRVLGFEAKRRLNDRLSLKLEGIAFAGIDREGDILSDLRRDGFVALNLVYGF